MPVAGGLVLGSVPSGGVEVLGSAASGPDDRAAAVPGRHQRGEDDGHSDHEHRQPHVLLDQDQGHRPGRHRPPAPLHEGHRGIGQQRHREGDLVELCRHGPLHPPGQDVDEPQPAGHPLIRQAAGQAGQRPGRERQQQVLSDEQAQGRGEEPPDRPQQNEDRVEVVTQEVVSVTLDRHDRGLEVGVGLGQLGEDRQIPAGHRLHRLPLDDRVVDHHPGADDDDDRSRNRVADLLLEVHGAEPTRVNRG